MKALTPLALCVVVSTFMTGCAAPVITCQGADNTKQYSATTAKDFARDWRKLDAAQRAFGAAVSTGDAESLKRSASATAASLQRVAAYSSAVPIEACARFAVSAQRLSEAQRLLGGNAIEDRNALRKVDADIHRERDQIRDMLPRWWFDQPQQTGRRRLTGA